jgi:uncharacterized protein
MISDKQNDELLSSIISNIKSTLEKSRVTLSQDREGIIELTDVIVDESIKTSGNDHIRKISNRFGRVEQDSYLLSDDEIAQIFREVLKPYLRSWLNQNLSRITKEVVEKEVKHLLEKVKI